MSFGPKGEPTAVAPAGTDRMVVNGVVVDLWEYPKVMDAVRETLSHCEPPAIAIGSVNLDHLHHFGRGRLPLPSEPERTGVRWLMLADGAPIVARAALLTRRSWPRLTGADLLPDLLGVAEREGHTVGFLGGMPDVHESLKKELARRYPQLQVVGYWSPERRTIDSVDESAELAREIRAAQPQILVVGLGKPRQELWINRHGADTGARLLLAFGASADFIAGKVDRAPTFYRKTGLEWAYRLAKEPRRLGRRYLVQGPVALTHLRRVDRDS